MALPAGVTTATVTVGVPVTHTGGEVKTFVSIEPSAFLVHAETGTPLVDFLEELAINEGVAGQFTLPHTDQAGFTDESGNAYTNWYYTARVTYSTPSKAKNKAPKVKVFQLTTGQTVVDLDKLPGGAPALPYIAPTAKVDAFNGRTGAVELLEADLPERLSEVGLSATILDTIETPIADAVAPVIDSVNFLADSTFSQRIKKKPDGLTWITTFQAGHTWTGATDINVNSTEVQFVGTQGVKYGPADPGTLRSLNSPTMSPIDLTGKQLVIAVKSNDDFAAGHTIYLADAAFANYRILNTDGQNYRASDGWVYLTVNPLGGSVTGTPNTAAVERIRININDPSGTHTELIGGVGYAPIPATYPNGVVTIDFDDNATNQFELARPLMLAKGWPATVYAIGSTADAKADGAMSVRDMHMLEDMFGWEIGAHCATSADHVQMQNLTDVQIEDSVRRVREWLTTNKFRANGFAYPFGGNDARVRAAVAKYFSWGRVAGYIDVHATPPIVSGHYVFGTTFQTTAAAITPLIDKAAARKQWLGLGFHGFNAGASSGGNMGSTDFATVLNYIESKGMAVVTPSTLFGLTR